MPTDHDTAIDGSTEATTGGSSGADTDESDATADERADAETDADGGSPGHGHALGRLSRRGALGVLAGLGGLGLVGATSQPASAQTALEFGGNYTSDPGSPYGLRLAPDDARYGLVCWSEPTDGRAIVGRATATSGATVGLLGRADADGDGTTGVTGIATASSGQTYGFKGRSESTGGRGALGIAKASSGPTIGLEGQAYSPDGDGVRGVNRATSGTTRGVVGRVSSPDGYGLYTPDDAKVGGRLEFTEGGATAETHVQIEVDGEPAISLDFSEDEVNIVNGFAGNEVGADTQGAVIAGGGSRDVGLEQVLAPNRVNGDFGTVGGGRFNRIGREGEPAGASTIGGGYQNSATGSSATVGGGTGNEAGSRATVGGGDGNTASGTGATVPGGDACEANGAYSFAAGREATAGHDGAIVFGDSTATEVSSQNTDEMRSQVPMYAPSFNTTSARAKKTNVGPVDPKAVLAGVESLDVTTWELDDQDDGRHVGPMAEEFHETFDVGGDDETIATVDADGVALAAIQGLAEQNESLHEELDEKADRIAALEAENAAKDERIEALEADREDLCERLAAIEEHLDLDPSGAEPTSDAE